MSVEPIPGLPSAGSRNEGFALTALLAVLLLLSAVKVVFSNQITQDDAFFLDVGRNLLDRGRLALSIWGNVQGHENFLGTYPPVVPALSAIDIWLVRALGSVFFIKTSGVLLMLGSAALMWRCLSFIRSFWTRGIAVGAVFLDPLPMTYFFTLRPEALLMPLMLVLYLSATSLLRTWDWRSFVVLTAASVAAALAHWQLAPSLLLVLFVLGWLSVTGRMRWRAFATYGGAVGGTYAAYAYLIVSSPVRAGAFKVQMARFAGTSGLLAKVKFLGGNVFESSADLGSAFSICLLLVLALVVLEVSRMLRKRSTARPDGTPVFDLAFLAVAIAPTLYVDYVGPRMYPLYLVVVLLLFRYAPVFGDIRRLALLGVAAAAVNYAGDLGLQYLYIHRGGFGPLVGPSLAWLLLAVALLLAAGWIRAPAALAPLALGAASLMSLALYGAAFRNAGFRVTDANVAAVARHLDRGDYVGKSILCDLTVHYLPLKERLGRESVYSTFPLFYFNTPAFFSRFIDSVKPDVVLATDAMYRSMGRPGNGIRFADTLRTSFAVRDTFTVGGVETWVYVRR